MRGSRLSRGKDKRLTSVATAGRLLAPAGPNGRSRHLSRRGEGGGATSEDRRGGKRLGGDAGRARLLSSAPVRALALFLPVYCSPSSRPRASTRRPHSVALCIPAPRPLCLCMRGRDGACACVRARRHEPNEASEWQPNATAREARSAGRAPPRATPSDAGYRVSAATPAHIPSRWGGRPPCPARR